MANRWKFTEVPPSGTDTSGLWDLTQASGTVAVSGTSFLNDANGNCFYADRNPTTVTEQGTSLVKWIETVDGESLRIETYRPGDHRRKTTYDLKLEYQSQSTYYNLEYLFKNSRSFYLYTTDPLMVPTAGRLYLIIDDFTVDRIALQGTTQIYSITLKCTDLSNDSTLSPDRWLFMEDTARPPGWPVTMPSATITVSGSRSFATDHAPSSASTSMKKRGVDIETINGVIVRVNPIRLDSSGNVVRVPSLQMLNIKIDYQTKPTIDNLNALYNNASEFKFYSDINATQYIGLFVIDDLSLEYMSVKGNTRLYGITLSLREVLVLS